MDLLLTLVGGVAWTVVYVAAIRIGFRQRTYAIPVAALALNFAWEVVYTVHSLSSVDVQTFVNATWMVADLVIVVTFFRFGRGELPGFVTRGLFVGWSVVLFVTAFAVQLLFLEKFGADDAARYSAFLQNLLMSGLFVAMFVARRGLRGQSRTIAVAKLVGTAAFTVLVGVVDGSLFILGLGVLTAVLDAVYLWLVWRAPALVHEPVRPSPVPTEV
ncbi:transmembrane-type terpene cyclase [Cellulomonas sp. URHB0016]